MTQTLEQINEMLLNAGHDTNFWGDWISMDIHACDSNYPVSFRVVNDNELLIVAKIVTMGEFGKKVLPQMMFRALSLNAFIAPYAFAILHDDKSQDPAESYLVIMDTLPLGDLSVEEMTYATDKLLSACIECHEQIDPIYWEDTVVTK